MYQIMRSVLSLLLLSLAATGWAGQKGTLPPTVGFDITQSVLKQQLAEGVTAEDAIAAMKSKAVELNMKLVSHQPLSEELEARGMKSRRLEIFQFCNPVDAARMIEYNMVFAAYMPCRIALVEDEEGKLWVMMLNLDMLINDTPLSKEVNEIVQRVNATLTEILVAAAMGEF